jgi:hypothetical protein
MHHDLNRDVMLERVGVPLQFLQLFKGVLDARQSFFFAV